LRKAGNAHEGEERTTVIAQASGGNRRIWSYGSNVPLLVTKEKLNVEHSINKKRKR
jgi:hypothetical protein